MNSTQKGDQLEDRLYSYLIDQQRRGELVYDLQSPDVCTIYKKKEYFCKEREAYVEFDVVIEICRKNSEVPFFRIVFECKNYDGNIPESCVTDFSDKLSRLFKHAAKGVLVVSSRLQSGADKIARSRSMGIAKYDEAGLEVIADRVGRSYINEKYIQKQIFRATHKSKPLKFSAYHDKSYFSDLRPFLCGLVPSWNNAHETECGIFRNSIGYLSDEKIEQSAHKILTEIGYREGAVNLENICSVLDIRLQYIDQNYSDEHGSPILGSANFSQKLITINQHSNKYRERFTLGHEIGHFYLNHERYLRSETIVEQDLFNETDDANTFQYHRLEIQANAFASALLLPYDLFRIALDVARKRLDIRDRGHGYVFVDCQPCNYLPYDDLLTELSTYFEVSKQVAEIRLKKLKLLTDHRFEFPNSSAFQLMKNIVG